MGRSASGRHQELLYSGGNATGKGLSSPPVLLHRREEYLGPVSAAVHLSATLVGNQLSCC